MKRKYKILLAIGAACVFTLSSVWAASVEHTTVLGGTVSKVVAVGTPVKEGDVLLSVGALAGAMPASRATVNGIVKNVLVTPGSEVHQGEVVVIVESK